MLSKRSSSEITDAAVSAAETPARRVHPFFSRTLFFKNVTRFWPLWLCYTVIWVFSLPVQIFVEMAQAHRYGWPSSDFAYLADRTILNLTSNMGVGLSLIFGLLAAVAVFSYLFSARSTGLMHTLPIRREGLFFTNYLSGLAFLFVPNLFIALLTFALESAAGILNAWNIVLWLLIQCGTCFFFYTFAVLCGMFTGNIIVMPALYGIFNCLALVISAMLDAVMELFIFGYDGLSWGDTLAEWLTPTAKLINELRFRTVPENGVDVQLFTGFQYVLAYCGVALVFLVCALYLYEARHMETAGDVIAVGWAKPVFKFGFAFCAALCGGILLYYTFRSLFEDAKIIFILFCLLSGAVGCFAAEMLLQKSFKVFRKKTWLSCGIFSACLVLLMAGVTNDIFGLERKVPDPGRVTSVWLSGSSLAPYDSVSTTFRSSERSADPEIIQAVAAMHQGIVNDRAFYKAFDSGDYNRNWEDSAEPTWEYKWLDFSYTLMDGSTLSRSYRIPFNISSETPDRDSVEGIFLALTNDADHLLSAYFPDESLNAQPSGGSLTVYNTASGSHENVNFSAAQAALLADAAREDILAGRLGIHYLNDYGEARLTNCAVQDLQLEWIYSSQNKGDGVRESATVAAINSNSTSRVWSSQITPQFTAESLMAALHDLGALDETHVLLSHTDQDNLDAPVTDRDTEVTYSYLK